MFSSCNEALKYIIRITKSSRYTFAPGCGPTITCVSGSAVPMFGTAHNIGGDQFICSVWCDSVGFF